MTRGAAGRALVGIALAMACSFPEQGEVALPDRQAAEFAANVEPFVDPGCASLDCHGDPGRNLRLFSRYGMRLDGALRTWDVTGEELAHNVAAFSAIPAERLLKKPLAVAAGGMAHVGGDLWDSADSPEYVCLEAWLHNTQAVDACSQAVAAAPY